MCTVAFVPLAGEGYLLGHNRDERRGRAPGEPPRLLRRQGCRILAPRDPEAGGTWIAANDAGVTVCILNAAERAPGRLPTGPRSRGLLVLDRACARSLDEVHRSLAGAPSILARTGAFHLVAAQRTHPPRVGRFRWDGVEISWEEGEGPALFVSSLLQPVEAERARAARWREDPPEDAAGLAAFLGAHEPARGPLSACMHREDAGTVSRTFVEVSGTEVLMRYTPGPPCTPMGPETRAALRL